MSDNFEHENNASNNITVENEDVNTSSESFNSTVENLVEKNNEEEEEEEGMLIEEIEKDESLNKSLCEMCKTNKWKYTCPKCSMHTCSLACVKAHKKEFSCDGKRDKVKYVGMNEYNENNLRNDYYFLEDVARANDNASREQSDFRRNKHSQRKNAILKNAKKKDIILKFMPVGMKKSQINKIYYNIKAKEINWTVELNFPDSEKKLKLIRTRIRDNMKIKEIINNCICEKEGNAMTRHNLSNYIEEKFENLKVFMKKEEVPANKQEFYSINTDLTISEVLAFKVVIEYPSFYILTPSSTFLDNAKIITEEEQETIRQEAKKKQEEERKKMKENNQKKKNGNNNVNNNNNNNNNNGNNNGNGNDNDNPSTSNNNENIENGNIKNEDIQENSISSTNDITEDEQILDDNNTNEIESNQNLNVLVENEIENGNNSSSNSSLLKEQDEMNLDNQPSESQYSSKSNSYSLFNTINENSNDTSLIVNIGSMDATSSGTVEKSTE